MTNNIRFCVQSVPRSKNKRHRSSLTTLRSYELFALKFSEYLGNVHSMFGGDMYKVDAKKSYKSKVHSMATARKIEHKSKAKSLTFNDKYNQSAIDELKNLYALKHDEENKNDDVEEDDDESYYENTSSSEDTNNDNVRIMSVARRGTQEFIEPNQAKTYRQSAIFSFSPEKKLKSSILTDSHFTKNGIESIKKLDSLPTLVQSDELTESEMENDEEIQIEEGCPVIIDNGGFLMFFDLFYLKDCKCIIFRRFY